MSAGSTSEPGRSPQASEAADESGGFLRVAAPSAIPEGRGRVYSVGRREVAVFRLEGGRLLAIDNTCPHVGGPLGEGELRGTTVYCPWHQWPFDLLTGCWERNTKTRVARYAVKEDAEAIYVSQAPLPPLP